MANFINITAYCGILNEANQSEVRNDFKMLKLRNFGKNLLNINLLIINVDYI